MRPLNLQTCHCEGAAIQLSGFPGTTTLTSRHPLISLPSEVKSSIGLMQCSVIADIYCIDPLNVIFLLRELLVLIDYFKTA